MRTGLKLIGIAASPGIAVGRVVLIDRRSIKIPKHHIPGSRKSVEIARFRRALDDSRRQLEAIRERIRTGLGQEHSLILDAHLLMMQDEVLVDGTIKAIREDEINAEWALRRTVNEIKEMFDQIDDDYFRERRSDVDFVGDRIVRNLLGRKTDAFEQLAGASIIVAHDLSPADTANLIHQPVVAFVTSVGTKTSHTALMARSLEIPAVVGIEQIATLCGNGDELAVDGLRGEVVVRPTKTEKARYEERASKHAAYSKILLERHDLESVTQDGVRVSLLGNIEFAAEAAAALAHGAAGVGLYRTEFLYVGRDQAPGEEEQVDNYRQILETVAPRPVVLRTFDIGGDKFASQFRVARELNPALGLRAVRLGLKERTIFKTQLRAMLRAATFGNAKILLPMISGAQELRAVRALLDEVRDELKAAGIEHRADPPLGIMIEVPSAVLTADLLARECDFFSIGTNDLIQYALAIDRVNEHVAYLYSPLHPAILRSIEMVTGAAAAAKIPVSLCGAMAAEPLYCPILVGLGVRELSMNPAAIPEVKEMVRATTLDRCLALAKQALSLTTAEEVDRLVEDEILRHHPDLFASLDRPGATGDGK